MYNQLKVEFFKLRHFWLFYIAVVGMAGMGFAYGYIQLAKLGCSMYDAFADTNCDTSFMFILALVSAWFIGSDFSSRTIHHEITLGYSRGSVLAVREISVYLSAVILHVVYIVFTMLGVGIKNGFSGSMFKIQDVPWCVTLLLQLIALQSIIAFISFMCAKASAAIAASVCFTFIMCNVLRIYFDGKIFTKLCFYFVQNNAYDTLIPASIVAILTWIAAISLTCFMFRKKEIK